jgi:hypothetical protein
VAAVLLILAIALAVDPSVVPGMPDNGGGMQMRQ